MAVFAHAEKNQIQNRLAGGIFRRDVRNVHRRFMRGDLRRVFAVDAMDLRVVDAQRREQEFVRRAKIAFRVVRRNAAFVRPEKMDEAKRDFARLGLRDDGREKFQRDASAGKRDTMRSGRVIGRRDFVQPRAGNVLGQFVGAGEGNEFKVLHKLNLGGTACRRPKSKYKIRGRRHGVRPGNFTTVKYSSVLETANRQAVSPILRARDFRGRNSISACNFHFDANAYPRNSAAILRLQANGGS